jgi:nuclear-control-of-ATPase protein 2
LRNLLQEIIAKLRVLDIPLRPSVFTPSSLRQLFPTPDSFRPGAFTIALFPHLRTNPHAFSLTSATTPQVAWVGQRGLLPSVRLWTTAVRAAATAPLDLTKQECGLKKKALQKLRDERAEALGQIADMQRQLENAIDVEAVDEGSLAQVVASLEAITRGGGHTPSISLFESLNSLATNTLPSHKSDHASRIRVEALLRPSRLTRLWPRLVLLPPLMLYAFKTAYASRASLAVSADEALETIDRFWHDWLLEPLKGVIKTVRAGSDERVIVSAKGVSADVEVCAFRPP